MTTPQVLCIAGAPERIPRPPRAIRGYLGLGLTPCARPAGVPASLLRLARALECSGAGPDGGGGRHRYPRRPGHF